MTDRLSLYKNCTLCPRKCGVDRTMGKAGFCGRTDSLFVSRAALHMWEEPCISGHEGSGTVFFSGCNLGCIFCQNHEISRREPAGMAISVGRLADIFLELQEKGANNINLVTGVHYIPSIADAIDKARNTGLKIPVLYNSGGYEDVEALKLLDGLIDIYLPDFKYMDSSLALTLSNAADYPERTRESLKEMVRQAGKPSMDDRGIMKKGVIVRHLVLPGHTHDSIKILDYLYETYKDSVYVSIMSQYTPREGLSLPGELNRKLTKREYEKVVNHAINLGITNGFTQEGKAASESFIPSFKDCAGVAPTPSNQDI